uniref:Uncharacterized protein n=1 Tax=Gadus morhua TaxID=8049 RepID=A0A8C5FI43_GADMO
LYEPGRTSWRAHRCFWKPSWHRTCTDATLRVSVSCQTWKSCRDWTPGTREISPLRSAMDTLAGLASASTPHWSPTEDAIILSRG